MGFVQVEIRRKRVDASRIRKKKLWIQKFSGYVWDGASAPNQFQIEAARNRR